MHLNNILLLRPSFFTGGGHAVEFRTTEATVGATRQVPISVSSHHDAGDTADRLCHVRVTLCGVS